MSCRSRLASAPAARPNEIPLSGDVTEASLDVLSLALPRFAEVSTFAGSLDTSDDFLIRDIRDGLAFEHLGGRVSGVLQPRELRLDILGASARQVMGEIVALYCSSGGKGPERAQVGYGARMVHLAAMRLSGGRIIRHVCQDGRLIDPVTARPIQAARLVLKPVGPKPLLLTPMMRVA
ncbi:hypothetical protein [Jannaschia seosinensis]|nr:hypothetical protein [Jannaschia seosinensis]